MKIIEPPSMRFYLPLTQGSGILWVPRVIVVATKHGQVGEVRPLVHSLLAGNADGRFPWTVRELSESLVAELRPWRLSALLFSVLGGIALAVAATGVYGTLSYAVSLRAQEISIRRAVGASTGDITKLVVAQGMRPVCVGVMVGLGCTLAAARLLTALLFGISATNLTIMGSVMSILLVVALAACAIPALHAVRIEPIRRLNAT